MVLCNILKRGHWSVWSMGQCYICMCVMMVGWVSDLHEVLASRLCEGVVIPPPPAAWVHRGMSANLHGSTCCSMPSLVVSTFSEIVRVHVILYTQYRHHAHHRLCTQYRQQLRCVHHALCTHRSHHDHHVHHSLLVLFEQCTLYSLTSVRGSVMGRWVPLVDHTNTIV